MYPFLFFFLLFSPLFLPPRVAPRRHFLFPESVAVKASLSDDLNRILQCGDLQRRWKFDRSTVAKQICLRLEETRFLRRKTTRTDLCAGKGRLNRCLEESRSLGKRRGRGGRKERGSLFVGRRDRYFSTGRDRLLSSDSKRGWKRGRGGFSIFEGHEKREDLACSPLFRFGLD